MHALAAGVTHTGALLCPIQDARAGQVYGAAFAAGMPPVRMAEDMAAKLEDYLEAVLAKAEEQQPLCFVGDGAHTYREQLTHLLGDRAVFAPPHLAYLRPSSAALLARYETPGDYLALQPYYLRAPQAERARKGIV